MKEPKIHPAAKTFPMLDTPEFKKLVDSIRLNGLQQAIVLFDDQILDGRNRYLACKDAGIEPRFVSPKIKDPWRYAWAANIDRRQIEDPVRVAVLFKKHNQGRAGDLRIQAMEEADKARSEKAKGKTKNPTGKNTGGKSRSTSTATKPKKGGAHQTRKKLAEEAGVSQNAMMKAMALEEKSPDLFNQVAEGDIAGNAAYRKTMKDEAIATINAEPAPLPAGPFRVIVADPPWAYTKRKDDGTHRAALTYPDMTTDEICAMDVKEIGGDDSVLWLWTTNAFMRDAYRVIDAWGYQEKTILTWAKHKMGTGDWLRGQTEHCIMAVRGKPTINLTNQTTLLTAQLREHSRKPEEFYALVKELCPGSRVELFSRTPREGFCSWGAEQEKFTAEKAS